MELTKRYRKSFWRWALVGILVLIALILCSCVSSGGGQSGGDGQDEASPIGFSVGESVEIASQTISTSGGTISINKTDDPLDGLTVEIPEGAYESPVTFTISESPISKVKAKDGAGVLSPLISIENGREYSNELIKVKMPLMVPDDCFAMAFFYDSETGEYEGLPTFPEDDNSLTFATTHFSDVAFFYIPISVLDGFNWKTGFEPGSDDWNLMNRGSYLTPDGYCRGMTLTSLYYYLYQKPTTNDKLWKDDNENGLGPENKTPDFWRDDKWAIQLCSVANAFKMTEEGFSRTQDYVSWIEREMDRSITFAEQEFYSIAFALWLDREPQLVSVRAGTKGHSLVCYGISNNSLFIADPNYPGNQDRKIVYDVSSRQFALYNSAESVADLEAGKGINFDVILYSGATCFYNLSTIGSLWTLYQSHAFHDYFPNYGILVTEYDVDGNEGSSYELHPTGGLTTNAKWLKFAIYAPFEARASVYRFEDRANALSPDRVELSLGDNLLGIYVEGENEGLWGWAGFDWVNITRIYEEELPPQIDQGPCSMESLRSACRRGVFSTVCPDGTCWRCDENNEPVQIECPDTSTYGNN